MFIYSILPLQLRFQVYAIKYDNFSKVCCWYRLPKWAQQRKHPSSTAILWAIMCSAIIFDYGYYFQRSLVTYFFIIFHLHDSQFLKKIIIHAWPWSWPSVHTVQAVLGLFLFPLGKKCVDSKNYPNAAESSFNKFCLENPAIPHLQNAGT